MSIDEIVHTCSNENVARAAVASIGISFASRIKSAADGAGVSVGAFTAQAVRSFAEIASMSGKREVMRAMSGTDQPILRGLEIILSRELEESGLPDGENWRVISQALPDQNAVAKGCCHP